MGELHQKKNDNAQAATFIMKVAESYAKDGFFLKAVALYKQVLKLDPSLGSAEHSLGRASPAAAADGRGDGVLPDRRQPLRQAGRHAAQPRGAAQDGGSRPRQRGVAASSSPSSTRERMNNEASGELRRAAEHLKRRTASTTTCGLRRRSARSSPTICSSRVSSPRSTCSEAIRSERSPSCRSASRPTPATSTRFDCLRWRSRGWARRRRPSRSTKSSPSVYADRGQPQRLRGHLEAGRAARSERSRRFVARSSRAAPAPCPRRGRPATRERRTRLGPAPGRAAMRTATRADSQQPVRRAATTTTPAAKPPTSWASC